MRSSISASESGWVLQNERLALHLTAESVLSLRPLADQTTWLNGLPGVVIQPTPATPQLYVPSGQQESASTSDRDYTDQHGRGVRLALETPLPGPALRLTTIAIVYDALPYARLQIGVQNTSTQPITVAQLLPILADWTDLTGHTPSPTSPDAYRPPLSIGGQPSGWAIYQHGWQSWSYSGALAPDKSDSRPRSRSLRAMNYSSSTADQVFHSWEQKTISETVALVGFPQSSPALLVGFLRAIEQGGQIALDRREGRLAAISHAEGARLEPGETCWSEPLLIGFGAEDTLLAAYAEMVAREMGARTGMKAPTGWCSWYYYFTRVTERDILDNLHALSERNEDLPLRVVQIDDGYQTAVGDWTSINEKFPGGMQRLATAIRDQGFQPGLWLAPFTATANSQLAQQHPDWLLRNEQGRPVFGGKNWGSTLYGLDCTHPQVKDWLQRLFATLVETWGYTYLKLDFLYCAALPGLRSQPQMTSVQALREGLQTIRATVGEEVFLLGCGCPLLPAIGLVDAMRIGPDVAPQWPARFHGLPVPSSERASLPSAANAMRNSLNRAWMHPTLWINDPDCLLIRDANSKLTRDEIRTLASVIGLTGGMLILSDPMHQIKEDRWSLASLLLPPLDQAAQPRSWLAEAWPNIITMNITRPWGAFTLAGLFNWTDESASIELSLASLGHPERRFHVCEFWSQRYFGIISNTLQLDLPAHGSAVLAVQPASDRPTLLSTDFHLGQGSVEVQRFEFAEGERSLRWEITLGRRAAGSTRIFLPPSWRPGALTTSAPEAALRVGSQPGEYHIQATIHHSATFTLSLEVS